jgi:hypothetical protein
MIELHLFTTEETLVRRCDHADIDAVVVDWEQHGKRRRQRHWDTQINELGVADLKNVRRWTKKQVICRINNYSESRMVLDEAEIAFAAGANEILLPMVTHPSELEPLLVRFPANPPRVGIMLETLSAFRMAAHLGQLPISRVYVGLNDLAIDRDSQNIFAPLVDDSVDRVRPCFSCPFGILGLTLPGRGYPIPTELLMAQLVRLQCDFTFLRRSFLTHSQGIDLVDSVQSIRDAGRELNNRGQTQLEALYKDFVAVLDNSDPTLRQQLRPQPLHADDSCRVDDAGRTTPRA